MVKFFHSLRFRLFLLVFIAVFPAFGLVIHNASAQRQAAKVQAQVNALQIAWLAADHQNEMVEAGRQLLFVLAQMPALQEDDREACSAFLSSVKAYNEPRYSNITKVDLSGRVLCDAISSNFAGRIPNDDFSQQIIKTRSFVIGNYIISPTTNRPTIGFGYPLLDEDGQVKARLIAGINLDSLNDLISQALIPPGSTITMWDRNGRVLARFPDPEAWIGKIDVFAPITQSISDKGARTVEGTDIDGVRRLYAYVPLRSAPKDSIHLQVGIPTSVAYVTANQMLSSNLWTLGLVAALAFTLAWVFSDVFVIKKVRMILAATNWIEAGDLDTRIKLSKNDDELDLLAKAFDRMGQALKKRELERQDVYEALLQEEKARAWLLQNLISAHEGERIRIARELHDETSQSLTALMIGFDTARMTLGVDDRKTETHLENLKSIAEEMLKDIHRLIGDLRPSLLDDLGLVPAILSYSENRLSPSGIRLQLQEDGINGRLPAILETALFRIIQEAFTNILRHSSASRVDLRLALYNDELHLQIRDDGKGFDPGALVVESQAGGFGLLGMQERVRMLEGEFQIHTAPGMGTKIMIRVPVPKGIKEYG